jgi:hypothetical protein
MTEVAPNLAFAITGGLLGVWLLVIAAFVWSAIDRWWFDTGSRRLRHWKLGRTKPLIVQRWRHVYGPDLAGYNGVFWCITRHTDKDTTVYRAGNAWSPEIAYARWRYNPKFWQGSHPVLKWA